VKVYLLKDIEKIGIAGEIINAKEGYAKNFLIPRKLGIIITKSNQEYYSKKVKHVVHRKEVVESKSSMLAEKIKSMTLTLKRKMHDDGKLYGAINRTEIVELLDAKGIKVAKNQIELDKSIKSKGAFDVTVKLSSRLQPKIKLNVVAEKK
jgi:large subunit ribosomal protein L9